MKYSQFMLKMGWVKGELVFTQQSHAKGFGFEGI